MLWKPGKRKEQQDYQQEKGILQKNITLEEMKMIETKIFVNWKEICFKKYAMKKACKILWNKCQTAGGY